MSASPCRDSVRIVDEIEEAFKVKLGAAALLVGAAPLVGPSLQLLFV
jgi:hypothetical protein